HAIVHQVRRLRISAVVAAQVLRHNGEGIAKHLWAPRPEYAAVDRREQPLVRVDDDRVGALSTAKNPAQLGYDGCGAAVCGVDMEPDAVTLAHGRDLRYRVDPGCRRCARGGHHGHRAHV